MAVVQYFNTATMELSAEVSRHPPLRKLLIEHTEDTTFEAKLARIATYCGLGIDGYFDDDAVNILCEKLIKRLQEMRTLVVQV